MKNMRQALTQATKTTKSYRLGIERHIFSNRMTDRSIFAIDFEGGNEVLGGAYERSQILADRAKMRQKWADYLDKLRNGAEVIPLKATAA